MNHPSRHLIGCLVLVCLHGLRLAVENSFKKLSFFPFRWLSPSWSKTDFFDHTWWLVRASQPASSNLIKVSKFQKGILMSSNPPKKTTYFFFNISSLAYNSMYSAGYKLEKWKKKPIIQSIFNILLQTQSRSIFRVVWMYNFVCTFNVLIQVIYRG